jgi:glutathione S-transferase
MPRYMGFDSERVRRSRREVEAVLERFDAEVQPSGYLVGRDFGVADLTLASLLSTFLYPPEFPYPLPVPFPAEVAEYRASLERYGALAWAREIYSKHRPDSAEVLRQVGRASSIRR